MTGPKDGWLLAVPLVGVNSFATWGQAAWAESQLGLPAPFGLSVLPYLFAATLESVSVWLSYQGHARALAGDSSLSIRLRAYAVALVMALLNYDHFAPGWRPSPAALTFGLLSLMSPMLWGIYTASRRRDVLRARGLVDAHAVRLSLASWIWWPRPTLRVYREAIWARVTTAEAAIERFGSTARADRTARPAGLPPGVVPGQLRLPPLRPAPPASAAASNGHGAG